MAITMQEVIPLGLCMSTQDLIDAKRFQQNFADNTILRVRDRALEMKITPIKRELNSQTFQKKYLEGHKLVIVNNIDKIMGLVASRYSEIDLNLVDSIIFNGKLIMNKVLNAESFDQIAELDSVFKSKITLPVYDLFVRHLKKTKNLLD
ncbi:MAG: hypothetical protein HYW23_02900 [Candidatus Aenigmarchaeota archaeon]|nr:hypothetical protein [Candidatus Aenigmarchaeota archaeon]